MAATTRSMPWDSLEVPIALPTAAVWSNKIQTCCCHANCGEKIVAQRTPISSTCALSSLSMSSDKA
eukprot:2682780-Pyramimonas_sp.AAC.1